MADEQAKPDVPALPPAPDPLALLTSMQQKLARADELERLFAAMKYHIVVVPDNDPARRVTLETPEALAMFVRDLDTHCSIYMTYGSVWTRTKSFPQKLKSPDGRLYDIYPVEDDEAESDRLDNFARDGLGGFARPHVNGQLKPEMPN